jgi:hypothetical protein
VYERLMELEEAAKAAKRGIHSSKVGRVRGGAPPAGASARRQPVLALPRGSSCHLIPLAPPTPPPPLARPLPRAAAAAAAARPTPSPRRRRCRRRRRRAAPRLTPSPPRRRHPQETAPPRVNDVSLPGNSARAKQYLPFFQRSGRVAAVVEYVLSGHRLKVCYCGGWQGRRGGAPQCASREQTPTPY